MLIPEIEAKIKNAPKLNFGTIFSESIDLFKKSIVHGFVMQLVILLISTPFIIVFYVPLVVAAVAQDQQQQFDMVYEPLLQGFTAGFFILFFIAVLILATLVVAIRAGFIRMLRGLDRGDAVNTKDLFYFFKKAYFGKILLLMIAVLIISILATMLFVLPVIYAMIPIYFISYFFAFNPEMSVGDMVKLSFKLGTRKWFISFGLLVVTGILALFVGLILCGMGMIFTAPFVYHPMYFIYKKVVGFDKLAPSVYNG